MTTPDFTGAAEEEFVVATLTPLAGGRVWETQVPDDIDLARLTDGGVKPYIIVRFAEPTMTRQGRNVGSGEQGQPQLLSFSVTVFGGDPDSVKEVAKECRRRLVDAKPSARASAIQSSGGQAYSDSDTGSSPTRFKRSTFFRTIINL